MRGTRGYAMPAVRGRGHTAANMRGDESEEEKQYKGQESTPQQARGVRRGQVNNFGRGQVNNFGRGQPPMGRGARGVPQLGPQKQQESESTKEERIKRLKFLNQKWHEKASANPLAFAIRYDPETKLNLIKQKLAQSTLTSPPFRVISSDHLNIKFSAIILVQFAFGQAEKQLWHFSLVPSNGSFRLQGSQDDSALHKRDSTHLDPLDKSDKKKWQAKHDKRKDPAKKNNLQQPNYGFQPQNKDAQSSDDYPYWFDE